MVKKVPANARDARNVGLTPGVGKVPWSACLLQSSATLCDPMAPMRVEQRAWSWKKRVNAGFKRALTLGFVQGLALH